MCTCFALNWICKTACIYCGHIMILSWNKWFQTNMKSFRHVSRSCIIITRSFPPFVNFPPYLIADTILFFTDIYISRVLKMKSNIWIIYPAVLLYLESKNGSWTCTTSLSQIARLVPCSRFSYAIHYTSGSVT